MDETIAKGSTGDTGPELDPTEVGLFAFQVWSYKQGEVVSLLIHLGDRLGLFAALDGVGPLTSDELASRTGLHERWVREWLFAMAAAKLLDYGDGDRFELTPVAAAVLVDEGNLAFATGAFGPPLAPDLVDDLATAFRTGVGLPYDRQGPNGAHRTERMLGPWARNALVPTIVPALDGVAAALEAGGDVVDVGCGAGVALGALAEAFPRSRFVGYDPSYYALVRARERLEGSALVNVDFVHASAEELPLEPEFDLVLTFDCLHDMTRPAEAMRAIRRCIRDDGTWLVKEIRCAPRFADNLANPVLAMMYGFSITSCMSSALSEPGGAGLGTLGLDPETLERMVREAGFTRFVVHDFDDPANLYYEVRP